MRSVRRSTCLALIENSPRRSRDSAAVVNDRLLAPAYSIFFSRPGLYPSPDNFNRSSWREKNPPAGTASAGRPFVLHLPSSGLDLPSLHLGLLRLLARH